PERAGGDHEHAALAREPDDFFGLALGGLARLPVRDELDADHRAAPPHVADQRTAPRPFARARLDARANRLAASQQVSRLEEIEHGVRGRAGDRVAAVRAAKPTLDRRIHQLRTADDARQRQAGGHRFGRDQQVGLDAVVLAREHATGAAETWLHFIDDDDDAVAAAERGKLREIADRRHDEAAFSEYRF